MAFSSLCRSSSTRNAVDVWMNSRSILVNQASTRNLWALKENVHRNSSTRASSHNKSDLSATNPFEDRSNDYGRHGRNLFCAALLLPFATYKYSRKHCGSVVIGKASFNLLETRLLRKRMVNHILVTDSIAFVRLIHRSAETLYMIDIESPESFRDNLRKVEEKLEMPYVPVAVTYVSMNKELEKAQIASWKRAKIASLQKAS